MRRNFRKIGISSNAKRKVYSRGQIKKDWALKGGSGENALKRGWQNFGKWHLDAAGEGRKTDVVKGLLKEGGANS